MIFIFYTFITLTNFCFTVRFLINVYFFVTCCLIFIFSETVLTKNVIASYMVNSQAECLFHCYENKECLSYNYEYALTDNTEGQFGLCEINNKRMSFCPSRKVSKEGHGYFEEMDDHEKEVYIPSLAKRFIIMLKQSSTYWEKS